MNGKLSDEQKAKILSNAALPRSERIPQTKLAEMFGVSQPSICAVLKRAKKNAPATE